MTDDKRTETIAKLLAKAEAAGTTPEEREILNAKATELMLKYGIDEAVARAKLTGVVRTEKIEVRDFVLDVPASYSYEYAALGYEIAMVFGARAIMITGRKAHVRVVGFASDLDLVHQLYVSLARQCTMALGPWFKRWRAIYFNATGSQRWNAKRGFITGFTNGVRDKLMTIHKQVVTDAGPGTELVLRDRKKSVDDFVDAAFDLSRTRGRTYGLGTGAGFAAGQRADVGQSSVANGVSSRRAIGG